MIVVFADDVSGKHSINAQEIQATIEVARMYGCRVFIISLNFDDCETADNALAYVPEFDEPVLAVWTGFIPFYDRYKAIYEAALKKNVYLVNTPEQFQTSMEFDKFYPLIEHLTPKSIILDDADYDIDKVIAHFDFPVFVKGTRKSNKDKGWSAVVAKSKEELSDLVQAHFQNNFRSNGKVIVRELVPLRKLDEDANGFPVSREYRVFVYKGQILDYGFYWDEYEDRGISEKELERTINHIVSKVVEQVNVPFFSLDIGQLSSGEWIVIELGDGQFSGLSQIPLLRLWSKISQWDMEKG